MALGQKRDSRRAFYPTPFVRWVAATGAGFLLGALIGGILELLLFYRPTVTASGYPSGISGVQVIPLGFSVAVVVATLFQARLAGGDLTPSGWGATGLLGGVTGMAATAAAGLLTPNTAPGPGWWAYGGVGASIALAVGASQAVLWRARPWPALFWLGATLIAWTVSLPLGWVVALVIGFPLGMLVSLVGGGGVGGVVSAGMIVVAAGVVQATLLGLLLFGGGYVGTLLPQEGVAGPTLKERKQDVA